MKEYEVDIEVTFRVKTTVLAEDWEQAYDIAEQRYYDCDYAEEIKAVTEAGDIDSHDIKVYEW